MKEFKDTQDAQNFGKRATKADIKELELEMAAHYAVAKQMKRIGNLDTACSEATKAQFCHEAIIVHREANGEVTGY